MMHEPDLFHHELNAAVVGSESEQQLHVALGVSGASCRRRCGSGKSRLNQRIAGAGHHVRGGLADGSARSRRGR